jgi:hypothetical protein
MSDFWKGVWCWFLAMVTIVVVFGYLGRAWVYNDSWKAGMMQECQSTGYTWGECFNVLHGHKDNFDK